MSDARYYGDDRSPRALAFIDALLKVCHEHGMSLGHEDQHGAFEVLPFDETCERWLGEATEVVPPPALAPPPPPRGSTLPTEPEGDES